MNTYVTKGHVAYGEPPDPITDWIVDIAQHVALIDAAETARVIAEGERSDAEDARNFFEEYNYATSYIVGNKVFSDGSSYIAINDTVGNDPPDEDYWLMIARGGEVGPIGHTGSQGDIGYSGSQGFVGSTGASITHAMFSEEDILF